MSPSPSMLRRPGAARPFRLYCFCDAGGDAAAFLPWQALLDPAIEILAVQLPGRAGRAAERSPASIPALVASLVDAIAQDEVPFAIFGHGLGALLAFELTRELDRRAQAMPLHLLVSGCAAPTAQGGSARRACEDDLLAVLALHNATAKTGLPNREFMELMVPVVKAELAMAANYEYRPAQRLSVSLTILAGSFDDLTPPSGVEAWKAETSGTCRVRWFNGDHHFIHSERIAVVRYVNAIVIGIDAGATCQRRAAHALQHLAQ